MTAMAVKPAEKKHMFIFTRRQLSVRAFSFRDGLARESAPVDRRGTGAQARGHRHRPAKRVRFVITGPCATEAGVYNEAGQKLLTPNCMRNVLGGPADGPGSVSREARRLC